MSKNQYEKGVTRGIELLWIQWQYQKFQVGKWDRNHQPDFNYMGRYGIIDWQVWLRWSLNRFGAKTRINIMASQVLLKEGKWMRRRKKRVSLRHQLVLKKLGLAWQAVSSEPTRVSPLSGTRCQPAPSKNTEADLSPSFHPPASSHCYTAYSFKLLPRHFTFRSIAGLPLQHYIRI